MKMYLVLTNITKEWCFNLKNIYLSSTWIFKYNIILLDFKPQSRRTYRISIFLSLHKSQNLYIFNVNKNYSRVSLSALLTPKNSKTYYKGFWCWSILDLGFLTKKEAFSRGCTKKPRLIFLCLESIKSAINDVQTTSTVPLQTPSDITWGIPATYATFSNGWKEHACKYTKASASSTNLITKYYAGLLHIRRKKLVLKKINWWRPINNWNMN